MNGMVALPSGERVGALGLGTWRMGERMNSQPEELAALRLGIELGATLIDTAEMYGDGRAEELVGRAIAGRRDEIFIVSKVYPHNATCRGLPRACERSLRRLATDRIDLYLLHWRGEVPLVESMEALARLAESGKIRYYGVSNFDLADMRETWASAAGRGVATNQLLYNLARRGIEWDLLPWLRAQRIPIMAYSPLEQGRLLCEPKLIDFGQRHGMSPAHVALAWLLERDDVIVIPKSAQCERVREDMAALHICLTPTQLAELERLFSAPQAPSALEML